MGSLNETPSSNRLHIGVFGKTNSGKSSLINAFTKQKVSIVSEVEGTTTDPVYKAMEISPIGPCVIIDTAGSEDESKLGKERFERTMLAADKTDIAIIVLTPKDSLESALKWKSSLGEKKIPCIFVINKIDEDKEKGNRLKDLLENKIDNPIILTSCKSGVGIEQIKSALVRMLPESFGDETITGNLVSEDDMVLLVMPQDIQAPKGRLILPQVQTIRELLDKKSMVVCVTTDKMVEVLNKLKEPPKLIITDSQVFDYVYSNKPKESKLTSFSVLFAALKGDLQYYLEGAKVIDSLSDKSKVLIAECCTHAPLQEDIGRVKIPNMLRKRYGENMIIDIVSGTDFPEDPSEYDLIIQCGGCMFNRKYILSRIDKARAKGVPMTNYGVTIAHVTGILDKIETT